MEQLPIPFEGKKADIARLLENGFDVTYIANSCSCSTHYVYEVMKSSQFVDWQRGLALAELHGIGAREAVKTLIEVTRDKKAPKQARVSAADKILQYTGYNIDPITGRLEVAPSQMTQEQIKKRLLELHNEEAQRSRPVIIDGQSTVIPDETSEDLFA